MFSSKVKMYI